MISKLWEKKEEPEPTPEPEMSSDDFIKKLKSESFEETDINKTPDKVDVQFNFENGEYIKFQIRNKQEIWSVDGQVKRTNGDIVGLNANNELRHRVLEPRFMGEDARKLGGSQLRLGTPPMPILPVDKIYYWKTSNGKKMYELNNVSVYAIRVVDLLKGSLKITSKMTSVEGSIKAHRSLVT